MQNVTEQTTHRTTGLSEKVAHAVPLIVFIVLVFAEAGIVHFIHTVVAHEWLKAPWSGPWLAIDIFVIGGFYLARFEARHTNPGKPSKDPILWLGRLIHRKLGTLALLVNSLLVGPMYVGAILKHENATATLTRSVFWSSVLYAAVWIPLLLYVWK